MTITVQKAQNTLDAIRKESETRLAALRAEVLRAEGRGYAPAIVQAEKELAQFEAVFERSIKRAEEKLATAKEVEDARAKEREAAENERSAKAEAKTKERALRAFMDAGGNREEFEGHWTEIRGEALKQAAIQGAVPEADDEADNMFNSL